MKQQVDTAIDEKHRAEAATNSKAALLDQAQLTNHELEEQFKNVMSSMQQESCKLDETLQECKKLGGDKSCLQVSLIITVYLYS